MDQEKAFSKSYNGIVSDSDEEPEDKDKSGTASRFYNFEKDFFFPDSTQSFEENVDSFLDIQLLRDGRAKLSEYYDTITGQLTQTMYSLIVSNELTPRNLEFKTKLTKSQADLRYLYLKRRYQLDENGRLIDKKRSNKIVCEPKSMYDLVINAHILNNHAGYMPIHSQIYKVHSNITREYTRFAIKFCTLCNQGKENPEVKKAEHINVYKNLLPFERIHIEVFEPFKDKKIEGKYSHILYCRDFHSRFVWIYPLKNIKFKQLVSAIGEALLSFARIPIFIESSTIERQDLFDVIEKIAKKCHLQLGLGSNDSAIFHSNGVARIKHLLSKHEEECLKDWCKCLNYGSHKLNRSNVSAARGIPNDLICKEIHHSSVKYENKKQQTLINIPSENLVSLAGGLGTIYFENFTGSSAVSEPNEIEDLDDTNLFLDDTIGDTQSIMSTDD